MLSICSKADVDSMVSNSGILSRCWNSDPSWIDSPVVFGDCLTQVGVSGGCAACWGEIGGLAGTCLAGVCKMNKSPGPELATPECRECRTKFWAKVGNDLGDVCGVDAVDLSKASRFPFGLNRMDGAAAVRFDGRSAQRLSGFATILLVSTAILTSLFV